MKNHLLVILAWFPFQAFAQVIPDQSRTSCGNQTESLYELLDANKVVLVSADGFDCSICQSHAPSIGDFATSNPNVRVWGALGFKYSMAQPTCSQANSWNSSYSWSGVFSFLDPNRSWAGNGYPTYTVIDPRTKTISYRGTSHTTAMNRASQIATEIITSNLSPIQSTPQGISATCCFRTVTFYGVSKATQANIYLFDTNGRIVETITGVALKQGQELELKDGLPNGMYIMKVQTPDQVLNLRLLVTDHE